MKTVGAREANQQFSRLLREAEAGVEIVITRNRRPVARLLPVSSGRAIPEREAAKARLIKFLEKGLDLGGRTFTRDEMHER